MPTFKASEETPELGYDFTPYGPVGVIREPSYDEIRQFRRAMAEMYDLLSARSPVEVDDDKATIVDRLHFISETLTADDSKEQEVIIRALADVTAIDYDVLDKLPYRLQQRFMGYVTGAFLANVRNDTES